MVGVVLAVAVAALIGAAARMPPSRQAVVIVTTKGLFPITRQ
jgi:hypothetical protein